MTERLLMSEIAEAEQVMRDRLRLQNNILLAIMVHQRCWPMDPLPEKLLESISKVVLL